MFGSALSPRDRHVNDHVSLLTSEDTGKRPDLAGTIAPSVSI
jgi:hypothetical protein